MKGMDVNPERAGRSLRGLGSGLRKRRTGRIDEQGNRLCRRDQLVQKLQSLRPYFEGQRDHTCHIAAGTAQAGDKSKLDRVGRGSEDDGYRGSRRMGGEHRRNATRRGNYGHISSYHIGGQCWQLIDLILRPAVFDGYVLTLYVTGLPQALAKSLQKLWDNVGRPGVEEPDHRYPRRLRVGRERPRKA